MKTLIQLFTTTFALAILVSTSFGQRATQYKRVHQRALKKILQNQSQEAIAELTEFSERYPEDDETRYMLAVAFARSNEVDKAIEQVKKALELGMPAGRFTGGTLTGLESIRSHEFMQKLKGRTSNQLVHGPMLGRASGRSISFWVRTAKEAVVEVVANEKSGDRPPIRSRAARTLPDHDMTAIIQLEGLTPETEYEYDILVDGSSTDEAQRRFRTLVDQGSPIKFRLAFGGGAGYVPENERAWTTIGQTQPDILLLLGDNVYSDDPQTPEMQHYCYYRRQSRPEFRALVASTPVYSIWDDHDFGTNDCSGGPRIEVPSWKRPVYEVFRRNWVNPYYGGGDGQPGCFYDFYIGDVHFIMLDGRYYRNLQPVAGEHSTMLGPVQRAWLLDRIRHSTGRLRVLCSPVPWVYEAKGDSKDTWNGFQNERTQIFDFLSSEKVDGVVLISADRHRSDLWKIDRPDGYTLYEFNSSRLTNQHVHREMEQAIFSFNKKQSFGLVDFDTTLDDPTITYRVVTVDGDEVFDFELKRSQLQHQTRE